MNIKEQVSVLWTLVVIILICLVFIILFRIKAPQESEMCFTNEEGDLRNGVLDYCKYLDNDCWNGFLNLSGGKGLYWKYEP